MKIMKIFLIIILLAGFLGQIPAPALAGAFTSYVSGITMQNLSGSPASVTIAFYDQAGTKVAEVPDSIPAYGVKDYVTVPVGEGFNGSAIISSNQDIGVASTLRGDNKGRGIYSGAKSGATSVILPILMKNWGSGAWNTFISVQNVGSGPADITIDYAACAGTNDEQFLDLQPGAAHTFDQATETCFPNPKTLTSAVVNSDQDIAVIVAQESSVVNSSLVSSGFIGFDKNPVVPLMNSNNPNTAGWRTAISIFNNGNLATNVTMTYVKSNDGSTCTETQNIPSKSSKVFAGNNLITDPPAGVTITCPKGERLVGSAWVSGNSANQDLVATVNQDRGSLASAYGAFSPAVATPKVVFPQIQDRNGAASQWASSFMILNVGTGPTYVKCTFANTSYAPVSGQLDSYKAWEDLQRDKVAVSYVGSGECTAYTSATYTTIDASAKIVAVVNVRGTGVGLFDLMMSYEGSNVIP